MTSIYLYSIPIRTHNCLKCPCENKYEYSFFPFTFLIKKSNQMVRKQMMNYREKFTRCLSQLPPVTLLPMPMVQKVTQCYHENSECYLFLSSHFGAMLPSPSKILKNHKSKKEFYFKQPLANYWRHWRRGRTRRRPRANGWRRFQSENGFISTFRTVTSALRHKSPYLWQIGDRM